MKRALEMAVVVLGLFLIVNAVAGGGSEALVESARTRCAAAGWPPEQLQFVKYDYTGGRFGFGGHGVVEFRVRGAAPPKLLRVGLRRYVNLLGWEAVALN